MAGNIDRENSQAPALGIILLPEFLLVSASCLVQRTIALYKIKGKMDNCLNG